MTNNGNGNGEMVSHATADDGLDAFAWEEPARTRNRAFPGPGPCLRIVRRGDTANFTFSPEVTKELGLTNDSRVIFGWDTRSQRLGIALGYGPKINLQRCGNAVVSKTMPSPVLDALMQGKEVVFFTPIIIPGKQAIVISATTACNPWTGTSSDRPGQQLPYEPEQQPQTPGTDGIARRLDHRPTTNDTTKRK